MSQTSTSLLQDVLTVFLPRGTGGAPDGAASSQLGDLKDASLRELKLWHLELYFLGKLVPTCLQHQLRGDPPCGHQNDGVDQPLQERYHLLL